MAKTYSSAETFLAFVDDPDLKEVLKSLPFKELGLTETILKGQTKEVINYLKSNKSPSILLVDISYSELPLTDLQNITEVCGPSVEIIVVGEKNDVGLFRNVLALGARDYIVKPLRNDLIIGKLREIILGETSDANTQSFSHTGQVITFVGAHGGVGTSTIAANSGWSISQKFHKHVGLVDLNLKSGAISYFFNLPQSSNFANSIVDEKHMDENIIENLVVQYNKKLSILSSRDRLLDTNNIPLGSIEKVINIFKKQYNYTLIDLPTQPDKNMLKSVTAQSNIIVIVSDLTLFSVAETTWLLDELRDSSNLRQKIIVLINRLDEYKDGYLAIEDFETAIGHKVDYITRFDNKSPLMAINEGIPLASQDNALSKDINNFMAFLLEGVPMNKDDTGISKLLNIFSSKSKVKK